MNAECDERGAFAHARKAYLWACRMDVAVRKPGNVSLVSAGHSMQAAQFLVSAEASCDPLFDAHMRVGERLEAAVVATRAVAGCNTNLGILLLCAPLARAAERAHTATAVALKAALETVLGNLDVADATAAFRAIAIASPGGLGRAEAQDVASKPSVDLRTAMQLAAHRDLIARQYANGFDDLFGFGLPAFLACAQDAPGLRVQRTFVAWLASFPDAHIVRKHGIAAAQAVSADAHRWQTLLEKEPAASESAEFADWDESLKAHGLNPGTSADLTVCTLFLAALLDPGMPAMCDSSIGSNPVARAGARADSRRD